MNDKIVLFGVGNVAFHVAKLLSGTCTIYGTTRMKEKVQLLESHGIRPVLIETGVPDPELVKGANVLVSFPPDGVSDAAWSAQCTTARSIIYISSTSVYGKTKGSINEDSPVDLEDPVARKRLLAESIWRQGNAVVLRCPGIYGPETGLHLRLKSGSLTISGQASHYVSRIHLDDLARIIAACFEKPRQSQTYVVGDHNPSTHMEAITWLCEQMGLPLPEQSSDGEAPAMLRGSRRIDAGKILADLQLTLLYPSYKDGYAEILRNMA